MGRRKEQEKHFTLGGACSRAKYTRVWVWAGANCASETSLQHISWTDGEILPVNTAKTRFSTKMHFVTSLSLLGEQSKLSFQHGSYFYLSQRNLSDVTVVQQEQNVSLQCREESIASGIPCLPGLFLRACQHQHSAASRGSIPQWYWVNQKRKVCSDMTWREISGLPRRKCRGQLKAEP